MPCVSVIMDRLSGDLPIYYRALTWEYYTTQHFCLTPVSTSAPRSGPTYWLACWLHSTPSSELSFVFIDSFAVSLSLFLCLDCIYHPFILSVMFCLSPFILSTTVNPSHLPWLISKNVVFNIHCCTKYNLRNLRSASFLLGRDGYWAKPKPKNALRALGLHM